MQCVQIGKSLPLWVLFWESLAPWLFGQNCNFLSHLWFSMAVNSVPVAVQSLDTSWQLLCLFGKKIGRFFRTKHLIVLTTYQISDGKNEFDFSDFRIWKIRWFTKFQQPSRRRRLSKVWQFQRLRLFFVLSHSLAVHSLFKSPQRVTNVVLNLRR